jgi:hypothetical protein
MFNPYDALEPKAFWKLSVAGVEGEVLPWPAKVFPLSGQDRIATAGSCFAQNVAKYLRAAPDVSLMETETLGETDPVYSGRYGNIYTPRQMTELLDECLSGTPDLGAPIIRRSDERYVDVFRPFMATNGFDSAKAVLDARAAHLTAIRPVFTDSSIFVFTLGLTEVWCADQGSTPGRAYPVCPGVYSDDHNRPYTFCNLSFAESLADTTRFLNRLAAVNPGVRVILTVSPVPLTATASGDHVLTATMLSKMLSTSHRTKWWLTHLAPGRVTKRTAAVCAPMSWQRSWRSSGMPSSKAVLRRARRCRRRQRPARSLKM